MENAPKFFVPTATPENQETVYADLAKIGGKTVSTFEKRIYSIIYVHDGEEWTATIGKKLNGVRYKTSRVKGEKVERVLRLSDPAIVLAIFSGDPFIVVTNHRLAGNIGSSWENPFMAGRPKAVTYFAFE